MGIDKLVEKDPEWKSSITYILIKNKICKTMKEINDAIDKIVDDEKNNKHKFENLYKNNIDYKNAIEYKRKQLEEEKKNKPKFNYNNL